MKRLYILIFILIYFGSSAYSQKRDSTKSTVTLNGVTIRGKMSSDGVEMKGLNTNIFKMDSLQLLPSILGNNDLFNYVRTLPGVYTNGNLDSGIYIRGGSSDNNMVLMNNAIVYNPFHLFGFFSMFNSYHTGKITMLKNNTDVKYTGRLAGVIDVDTPMLLADSLTFKGSVGLISSQFNITAPISKISTVYASGRASYLSQILSLTKSDIRYDFSDFNLTLVTKPTSRDVFISNVYYGKDKTVFPDTMTNMNVSLNISNFVASEIWQHRAGDLDLDNTLFYSEYNSKYLLNTSGVEGRFNSSISDFGYKSTLRGMFCNYFNFLLSGEVIKHHTLIRNPIISNMVNVGIKDAGKLAQDAVEYSLGGECEYKKDRLRLKAGAVAGGYNNAGTDKYFIEPKFECQYFISPSQSVSLQGSGNHQYAMQIPLSPVNFPINYWLLTSDICKPENSYNLSCEYNYESDAFSFSLGAFYNRIFNQKEMFFNWMDVTLKKTSLLDNILNGDRKSYGLEAYLYRKYRRFTWRLDYTLSWSKDKYDGVNDGEWFNSRHDRRHNVVITGMYKASKSLDLSGNFTFATGSSYTSPQSLYMTNENVVFQFGRYNNDRYPNYIRFDCAANYKLKSRGRWKQMLNMSVYNAFLHKNPVYITYKATYDKTSGNIKLQQKKGCFYSVIPSVSYIVEF